MLKSRIALSAVAILAVSVIAFSLTETHAQRSAAERERLIQQLQQSRSRSRSSSSLFQAAVAAPTSTRAAATKTASPAGKRTVEVEILFVEFETPDAGKGAPPAFGGDAKDIEKRIQELKTKRQLKTLQRVRLSAIDGQTAMTQLGDSVAQVTGSTRFAGGRNAARSYSYRNFGTVATVTPQIDVDGSVALDLHIEKSWPIGGDKPSEPEEVVQPPGTATVTLKNSFRVKPGTFTQVSTVADETADSIRQTVVLVSVRLGNEVAKPAKKAPTLRVISLKNAEAGKIAELLGSLYGNQSVIIVPDQRTNTLVVGADELVFKSMVEILQAIDVVAKDR